MEFLLSIYYNITISVPIGQLMLLLGVSTLSLLFGKIKLALLINYIFTIYWAYVFNRDFIFSLDPEKFTTFTLCYFGFGITSAVVAAFSLMLHREA